MTKQQQRALEIAERDHLTVCGHGTAKDGRPVYAVPSRSEQGRWHLVIVADAHLVCDCKAAQRGQVCAHRAAVHQRLVAEREAKAAARSSVHETALPVSQVSNASCSIWKS